MELNCATQYLSKENSVLVVNSDFLVNIKDNSELMKIVMHGNNRASWIQVLLNTTPLPI